MAKVSDEFKTIVIAGNTYTVRPAKIDDFDVDLTNTHSIPDATADSIDLGLKPDTEKLNMWGIYDTEDARSSAFVASIVGGSNDNTSKRVGFAMHARNRKLYSHEFYISVDRSLAQSTLPAQLLRSVVKNAKKHGTKILFCHSDEHNSIMRNLAERVGMLVNLEAGKSHGVKYTLMLDNHPDLIDILDSSELLT